MKIDVQGAEASLRREAMEMLQTSRPIIILEIDSVVASEMGVSATEAWGLLTRFGYRFFRYGPRTWNPFVYSRRPPKAGG